jgi:hypothetical protein
MYARTWALWFGGQFRVRIRQALVLAHEAAETPREMAHAGFVMEIAVGWRGGACARARATQRNKTQQRHRPAHRQSVWMANH